MSTVAAWPHNAETWLDERGKPAWIVAMILGFMFFPPIGFALLLYMIWSKRMFAGCNRHSRRSNRHAYRNTMQSSGNSAFDAYKADTLRRLEDEQGRFGEFLQRLRDAKDKSEFDDFMDERAKGAKEVDEPVDA